MKQPKILKQFCDLHGLQLVRIKYKYQSIPLKRCGWELVNKDNSIIFSIEPKSYGWFVRNTHEGYIGKNSFSRISKKMLEKINPNGISYYKLIQ
jgi:hypothetical protein